MHLLIELDLGAELASSPNADVDELVEDPLTHTARRCRVRGMKILLCQHCRDGVVLVDELRRCHCGATAGRYIDRRTVEISDGYVVGLDNRQLTMLLEGHLTQGSDLTAFSVNRTSPSIVPMPAAQQRR